MIFILEDDANIRKLIAYTLQSQGFEFAGFERPSLFWEALKTAEPELILLDIMLPAGLYAGFSANMSQKIHRKLTRTYCLKEKFLMPFP